MESSYLISMLSRRGITFVYPTAIYSVQVVSEMRVTIYILPGRFVVT